MQIDYGKSVYGVCKQFLGICNYALKIAGHNLSSVGSITNRQERRSAILDSTRI
jgi:hypothetical protein